MQMIYFKSILFALLLGTSTLACKTTGQTNKAKLLDATMDPAKSQLGIAQGSQPRSLWEKAQSGGGSSVSNSCPTCGT